MIFFGKRFRKKIRSPETEVEALSVEAQRILSTALKSIIVFGSSASGEFHQDRSDINVLILVENLSLPTLKKIAPLLKTWTQKESSVPVLMEENEVTLYARTLPIEFLDLQQHHRVVFGVDPFPALKISTQNLRAQCEQELSVKLLKLRQAVATHIEIERSLRGLLVESLSSILTLFRAALRLEEEVPAMAKLEAAKRLAEKCGFEGDDLERLHDLRLRRANDPLEPLAGRYLSLIQKVLRRVAQTPYVP